jgi:hypothetical protein
VTGRTESPELNRRINTLIMRGLSATEATDQATAEQATGSRPGRPDYHKDAPVPVRIPPELLAWIDRQGRPRSAVIIEAIREKRERETAG